MLALIFFWGSPARLKIHKNSALLKILNSKTVDIMIIDFSFNILSYSKSFQVAILSEMIGSGKASDKLLTMYFPFLGLGVLAILRGLLAQSGKTASSSTVAKGSSLDRKKRAWKYSF